MALFADQTFVITGASGGIGQAIANGVARNGATVCLCGRDKTRLTALAKTLPTTQFQAYQADFASTEALQEAVRQVQANNARIDALIHCAAAIDLGPVETASAEGFERQFRLNVLAPFQLTQLLLPQLVQSRGQIVFINSSAGLNGRPNAAQYSATKHALKALADSLRQEINSSGVRVSSLFLGDTATPMQERIRKEQGRSYEPNRLMQPGDVAEMVVAVLGLGRTAEVTDIVMRPMQKS